MASLARGAVACVRAVRGPGHLRPVRPVAWALHSCTPRLACQLSLPSQRFSSHAGSDSSLAPATTTVDAAELRKFAELAAQWWREDGPFAGLHAMNAVRVPLIRRAAHGVLGTRAVAAAAAAAQRGGDAAPAAALPPGVRSAPLEGLSIVDIGCGGGILSEALARLGASVTGVDAAGANIGAASAHRALDPRLAPPRLEYVHGTAEALAASGRRYDVVVASEVIEHVASVDAFLDAATALMKVRAGLGRLRCGAGAKLALLVRVCCYAAVVPGAQPSRRSPLSSLAYRLRCDCPAA